MKKALLIVGGLGVLGYGIYRYFKKQVDLLKNFSWSVVGFKIFKITATEMSFEVKFKLTSESDIQASVEKMYFDLYVNDTNVGFISETKSFVLPAHGSSVVPLTISINPQSILKNLLSLSVGIGKNKDFMLKMDGYANVRSGFVALTLPIKYETSFKQYLKDYFPSFGI